MENVKRTSTTYIATESGKGWSKAKKNIATVEEVVSMEFYNNFVESAKFFGSRCERSYERIGYVITKMSTIAPDGATKTVDEFSFE